MSSSITLLPEQADLIRESIRSFEVPAWEPASCRVCSNNFKLIKGTGKVDGHTCIECGGSGYGPQYRMLGATEDEILGGGARRGGKSDAAMMFLIKGNPNEDQRIPYNQSYAYHPKYRALLIRKDQGDLEGFLLQASPYYAKRGGKLRGSPGNRHVQFNSGAVIWTGHLKDSSSFEKYIGRPELHRIVVEELTLIPELRFYLILKSSLSTSTPELKTQMLSTTNPPGIGSGWVRDRFVRVRNPDGKTVPWGKTIYVDVGENPFTGKREYNTRVFIPAKVIDNPHVSQDYIRNLMDLPEKERRAYLHGDWDALQGTFFSEFRNPLTMDLPLVGEPGPDKPNYACHVIVRKPVEPFYPTLSSWWRREMGGDWGFAHESAILWGARDPESQQIHIYRELLVKETGAQTLGHTLAMKSLDELNASPTHSMTLWFSPDAFRRHGDDEGVSAHVQLIAQGIGTVLGPDAVHIPELEIQQRRRGMVQEAQFGNMEFQQNFQRWSNDLLSQQNSGITIRKANNNRILGWDYIREMLAWNSPLDVKGNYDQEIETKILHDFGERAARRYRNLYTRNPGSFPRLQIWDTCPRLMDAFPRMAHDEKNPEDISKIHVEKASDVMDAVRYLLICFQQADPLEPFAIKEARILAEIHAREPEANLTLVSAFLRANKELQDPPAYANIRRGRGRHRHGRVKGGRR